jgi:hypothetical protein
MSVATAPFTYRQKTYAMDDVAGMVRGLEEDGFALVPGVLSSELVQQARDKSDELRPIHWDNHGGTLDHFKNVFQQDTFWLQFLDMAPAIDIAEATMTKDCHIIGQTAWRSRPGQKGWGIHVDQMFISMDEELLTSGRVKLPVYICTAHYYLSDITIDLCPTWVIPGSHKSGRAPVGDERVWNGREIEPVLCKAGDMLFFRSEIWHTGSNNDTKDQVRYLLQVHYGGRNVAQHFAPFLHWQFKPEVLAAANPRQLRLLGDHKRQAYD